MSWQPHKLAHLRLRLWDRDVTISRSEAEALWRFADPPENLDQSYRGFSLQAAGSAVQGIYPNYAAALVATDGWRLIAIPVEGPEPRIERFYSASALWELAPWSDGTEHLNDRSIESEIVSARATFKKAEKFPLWDSLIPGVDDVNVLLSVGEQTARFLCDVRGYCKRARREDDAIHFYQGGAEQVINEDGTCIYEAMPDAEITMGSGIVGINTKFLSEIAQIWPEGYTLRGINNRSAFLARPSEYARSASAQAVILVMPLRLETLHLRGGEADELI